MRRLVVMLAMTALTTTLGCAGRAPEPPRAEKHDHVFEEFGHRRVDPYYWLRERDNPEVIDYLERENAYADAVTAPVASLQEKLFQEIVGRIKQDDDSVPYFLDGYWYYVRYEQGKDYALYCRKRGSLDAPEEVMLDGNAMAEGHDFFAVRGLQVSSGNDLLAFATDTVGRRRYTIRVKDLTTGELLPDRITDTAGNLVWAADNRTLFYTRKDTTTLRPYRVYRHVVGTDPAQDELVYQEDDETFDVYVYRSKSRRYLFIGCDQTLTTEIRYLDAATPGGEFRVFAPRERGHDYTVDHVGDTFYIRTNWKARNFRLMACPEGRTARESWTEVVPHRDDVLLEDFTLFRDFIALEERFDGLMRLRVLPREGGEPGEVEPYTLTFDEPTYLVGLGYNPDPDSDTLRFVYTSLTTPRTVYDQDMRTRERILMKRDEVLGDFDPHDYVSERLWATARDGVKIPISLVYRKDFRRDGTRPLLLYGYGSYGYSTEPRFSSARLSLLDRGFCYAIAHVRGGQEMGRWWYEDGKLLKKKNTFTDFIDCARYLVEQRYTSPEHLYARGGSAGGLLMGAVANMAPELFHGIVADVPFVDVVTTMLDPSIPLTTVEYDEWGDPRVKKYYEYILSYSPYDNVTAQAYPHLLVTTGLHDSQVQYWEPAKWVAKLRDLKTDDHLLLLKTNMAAGHGGMSGRLRRHHETAYRYAFLLMLEGIER